MKLILKKNMKVGDYIRAVMVNNSAIEVCWKISEIKNKEIWAKRFWDIKMENGKVKDFEVDNKSCIWGSVNEEDNGYKYYKMTAKEFDIKCIKGEFFAELEK